MDDLSHLRDEESDGRRDRETPPDLMATVRSLKVDNERLMRAHAEQEELNAVLLQSLSEIQKHLQQGPSNAELQQSERLKTPSDAQKHGLAHNDVGRSSSKRKHRGTKRGESSGGISTESSSRKTISAEQSSSGTNPTFLRRERGRILRVF
jgi:hypothetical protein